jgi:hypothetical protein
LENPVKLTTHDKDATSNHIIDRGFRIHGWLFTKKIVLEKGKIATTPFTDFHNEYSNIRSTIFEVRSEFRIPCLPAGRVVQYSIIQKKIQIRYYLLAFS